MNPPQRKTIGRGSQIHPANRYEKVHLEDDLEQCTPDDDLLTPRRKETEFLPNTTRKIISENDSPDIPFRYSINVYRGCEHGWVCCSILPPSILGQMKANSPRVQPRAKKPSPS